MTLNPRELLDRKEQASQIDAVLESVGKRYKDRNRDRRLLELRTGYKWRYKELAPLYKISPDYVMHLVARMLRMLRHPSRIERLRDIIQW